MIKLLPEEIQKTAICLHSRIASRFPESGLKSTCAKLIEIADEVKKTMIWISTPNYYIRISSWLLIIFLAASIVNTFRVLNISVKDMSIADFFQMIDAAFNSIVMLFVSGFFLMNFETKRKRKRVIRAVNRLRCLAHVVDAHQLSKDPSSLSEKVSSGKVLTDYELSRYLDYCSEMLSLASKLAFLYVQEFDDSDSVEAVNDLEVLTNGISGKIWQKISMIRRDIKDEY